jgi:tripeptidyl-peptidase-1
MLLLKSSWRSCFFSKGGLNNQTLDEAGDEADLDVQFAFGLSHPIAVGTPRFISYNWCTYSSVQPTFYSTGGSPPFNPDVLTPTDTNE